ncbi:MAG: hypothetical protein KGI79_01280 [Patescibacteria group bacterium]|nr:hypothetical protein [Patescibacteria group bacterium]MDE2116490.1 hypothetical protein [Patescibacteria group bacterium]
MKEVHIIIPESTNLPLPLICAIEDLVRYGGHFEADGITVVLHTGDTAYERAKNPILGREAPIYEGASVPATVPSVHQPAEAAQVRRSGWLS